MLFVHFAPLHLFAAVATIYLNLSPKDIIIFIGYNTSMQIKLPNSA